MKKGEVPQHKGILKAANLREMCYAVDENGEYTTALSTGWDPKTIALENALKEIEERVENAMQRVLAREASPIVYYMELHKMDLGILASYVGIWKWRVKRHFKPSVFKKLSSRTLQKYADVFDITVEELVHIDP
ncbi:hypothetical protein [Ulvibacterium sp.]|uniref:hypothetical protein n=1 Tax=Ulvibacterium sp. TaxID=2665914 RepID=UPI003BAA08E5